MKILEFGNKENRKLVFIHGFQCPWQIWNRYIEVFQKDFHVIVPVLKGHDVETKEDFISIHDAAKDIENYLISRYGRNVFAVYGISMGGVVAAQMWSNGNLEIENLILDGAPLVRCNRLMKRILLNFYMNITHKTQKRNKKVLEQAIGSVISQENFEDFLAVLDNMTDNTITNCVMGIWDYKLPKDIVSNAKIHFFHGTKINEFYAKKTAKYLKKHYPNAKIKCFDGKSHCENALLHPEIMINELKKIIV